MRLQFNGVPFRTNTAHKSVTVIAVATLDGPICRPTSREMT